MSDVNMHRLHRAGKVSVYRLHTTNTAADRYMAALKYNKGELATECITQHLSTSKEVLSRIGLNNVE